MALVLAIFLLSFLWQSLKFFWSFQSCRLLCWEVNILENARRKRFLSLSPLINSSNSSCTESEIDDKRSKIPSVESLWSVSLARYASSSLVSSSKISTLSVSAPACDYSKSKRFSVDPAELPTDMLMYLFLLLIDVVFCCRKYLFSVFLMLKRHFIFCLRPCSFTSSLGTKLGT